MDAKVSASFSRRYIHAATTVAHKSWMMGCALLLALPLSGCDAQRIDRHGDALPPKAIARLGTLRFRHNSWIHSVAYRPDGAALASGGNSVLRLWESRSGELLFESLGSKTNHSSTVFSPDGALLASAHGMTISVYDSRSGENLYTIPATDPLVFSPDGRRIAAAYSERQGAEFQRKLGLWDARTGHELEKFDVEAGVLAFSPDGKLLAAGGGYTGNGPDKPLALVNPDTGRILETLAPPEGGGPTSAVFSPDEKYLITTNVVVNRNGEQPWEPRSAILVWEVPSWNLLHRLKPDSGISNDALAISPDSKILAVGGWSAGQPGRNNFLSLWDITSGQPLRTLPGHEGGNLAVAFSPDGKVLASGGADPILRRWSVSTGQEIQLENAHAGAVTTLSFSPDGTTLASGSTDHTIRTWDPLTGRQRAVLPGHSDRAHLQAITYSPDGKYLASGANHDSNVILWDVQQQKEVRRFPDHQYGVASVAFSPDGEKLATGALDRQVRIWDVSSGKKIHELPGHEDHVTAVTFSPDGKVLASGGGGTDDVFMPRDNQTIRLWDANTGEEIGAFGTREQGPVRELRFSPDAIYLLSGGGNPWATAAAVNVWAIAEEKVVRRMAAVGKKDKEQMVQAVAFSPKTNLVATAHHDGSIRLWDTATAMQTRTFQSGHRGNIATLAFSSDGKRLASGSADTTVLVWDVEN